MSGKFLARASALSLAMFLAACGGDDDSTPLVDTGGDESKPSTGTGDNSTPDNGNDSGSTGGEGNANTSPTYSLGPISADGVEGEFTLTLGETTLESASLRVTILDADGNPALTNSNSVIFGSVCENSLPPGELLFSPKEVAGSEGYVLTTYTPSPSCVENLKDFGGKDTISARFKGSDDIIRTIDVTLETQDSSSTPAISLGYFGDEGQPQSFKPNEIGRSFPSDIITVESGDQDSVNLWVSLVDADRNLIQESENQITFSSTCSVSGSANFSKPEITISEGKVQTRYNPDPECLAGKPENEDIITARLNDSKDVTAITKVKLSKSKTALQFSDTLPKTINVGEELSLPLEIINSDTGDILKDTGYTVALSSVCSASDWATFQPEKVSGKEGRLVSVYSAAASCHPPTFNGKDTITARLLDGEVVVSEASWDITVLNPASSNNLAFGALDISIDPATSEEVRTFRPEEITIPNNSITANSSTGISVSIVDPSNNFALVRNKDHSVSFSSVCSKSGYATFDLGEISGSEGTILTKYTPNEDCATEAPNGEDVITATLSTNEGELTAQGSIRVQSQDLAPKNQLANLVATPNTISVGDVASLAVEIVDQEGNLIKNSENKVTFSSICSVSGEGSFNQTTISGSEGKVLATYNATEACRVSNGGSDIITARLNGNDLTDIETKVTLEAQSDSQKLAFGAFTSTPSDPFVSFRGGRIAVIDDTLMAGETTGISVSIVDPSNAFGVIKDETNRVSFESICTNSGVASISPSDVSGGQGKVIAAYTPTAECAELLSDKIDVITATLTTDTVTLQAEAVVTLQNQAWAPEAALAPLQATSSSLTVGETATIDTRIIDPQSGDLIKQSDNSVSFSSICSVAGDASFNSPSVSGSEGFVYTQYTASPACLTSSGGQDVITARLNGSDDVRVSLPIELNPQPTTDPSIGTGAGGNFVSGSIEVSPSTSLIIGDEEKGQASVTLSIVDQNNSNSPLVGLEHNVSFFSACISSGWASMDNRDISTEAGEIRATYTPGPQCVGEDTLFAKLNDDSEKLAQVTFTNTPIVQPPEPVIKVGSLDDKGEFQSGKIRAINPALTLNADGEASTDLIVNIQIDGEPASAKPYDVQFTSMCIDANRASVTGTNSTQSGAILATYNASPDCLGTDNVVVFLNGENTLKANVDINVSDTKLAIGSYDGSGRFTDSLAASRSQLDYNKEPEPTSEIRSVIAKVDDNGTFIEQLTGFQSSVEFFSTCLDSDLATIESTGNTESGELISTYRAQGCVGTDTLYGRITGTNEVASVPIQISPKVEQVLLLGHFDTGEFTRGEIGKSRTSDLPVGAQTRLYLSLVDEADTLKPLTGIPLSVELSSTCEGVVGSDSPFAATNLSLSNGYAEVLYTAQTCGTVKEDIVKATLTGSDGPLAKAKASISLDKNSVAHSLTASQPEPNSIAPGEYDGTYEDRTSTSVIQFQLKNKNGNGANLANKEVSFRLDDPAVSGIALTPTIAETNDDGFVTVTVKAKKGAQNSVFRVIASHENLETYSAPIAVNSKLPFAERFSLSTSNFAPDTQPGKNGIQVELTVLAADVNGNRLRGNTIVNFKTDQGSIDPECVLDDNGRCTVIWESLNVDDTFATIEAYTHGREADASGQPAGTGEIQAFTNMLMSSSDNVQVLMERTVPAGGSIDPESNTYCATTWVNLPNETDRFSPPSGTGILFSLTQGEFINNASSSNSIPSSSSLLARPGYTACTKVRPAETVEEIEIPDGSGGVTIIEQTTLDIELSVTVTPPADAPLPATDYIKETYQF
ncbi:hypothetical protein [Marinobacter piscensis]|uniref:hypothetical protein n=1 Tax=Marinobacter piscensis TaxID=1562308 RepID=UPI0011AAB040|nr:hypothetical protein [Marinobacter piscensis]